MWFETWPHSFTLSLSLSHTHTHTHTLVCLACCLSLIVDVATSIIHMRYRLIALDLASYTPKNGFSSSFVVTHTHRTILDCPFIHHTYAHLRWSASIFGVCIQQNVSLHDSCRALIYAFSHHQHHQKQSPDHRLIALTIFVGIFLFLFIFFGRICWNTTLTGSVWLSLSPSMLWSSLR